MQCNTFLVSFYYADHFFYELVTICIKSVDFD